MVICLYLFLSIFFLPLKGIPVGIFCDDYIRGVFLVENGNLIPLAGNADGSWDVPYVYNLNLVPGDLVMFRCYNAYGGNTHGAGCFHIYGGCRCYEFEINKARGGDRMLGMVTLNGEDCYINVFALQEINQLVTYEYRHYVPLDATQVYCRSSSVLYYLNGVEYTLYLSNYITSSYSIKNVESSIMGDNYIYFKLNNNALVANQIFNVASKLTFNSTIPQKYNIIFRNYGKVYTGVRDCSIPIRVCHIRCSSCYDLDIDENNHQCKTCKENFFFIEGTTKCMTKEEMNGTNYYFNETENIFKKCYIDCKTCLEGGNEIDMKCNSCGLPKVYYAEPHNCIDDITRYYYSEEDKIYKRCYKSCYSCDAKSIEEENNCTICEEKYHYIYTEISKRNCIHETKKPLNTYLDNDTNTYELCYERCNSCSQKSDIVNNNCDECLTDANNNFLYHFVYNKKGQCLNEKEKPSNTYLNTDTNTYELCYERCASCDIKGDSTNNNCNECLKDEKGNYLFHFIHDEKGKCLNESERPLNTYLELETNSYELCYKKCSSCDKKGDINNNNCKDCLKDDKGNYIYHFIFNNKGKCINKKEKISNSYLDTDTNTFRLCYERCSLCDKAGNDTNNNCDECTKDENNTYLYHFIFNETGRCLNETEKPSNTYLDNDTNTYRLCYKRCSTCDLKGNYTNNNCKECLKDENNTFLYHFVYNKKGQCLNESEKPSNTYLDNITNTYELCYERCSTCDIKGDSINNNCNECLKDENNSYIYHFVYNETGKCINQKEKPSNTYLNTDTNTYELCYERCASCDIKGDSKNNNCNECAKDENNKYIYHFIYNETGRCLSEEERPLNTYLNIINNTYELCYGRCYRCDRYPECKICLKDEESNFIYHFIHDEEGKCIDESEIKDGFFYLDINDNTYKKCPEGTIRVVNNEYIENNIEAIILALIIVIIIILVFLPSFLVWRIFFRKRKIDNDMMDLVIN